MPRLDKVANRYAKAIADLFGAQGKIREVIDELSRFADLMASQADLNLVLATGRFSEEGRRAIINDIAERLDLSTGTRKVLFLLAQMNRLGSLTAIIKRLKTLSHEASGVVPLEVQAASNLTREERETIERKFSSIFGKKVDASYSVNPGLIGGVRVMAGSRTFDGSLSGWLGNMEEQLVGGRF